MARGYPDFFGQPTFPGYGTGTLAPVGSAIVGPGATKDILDVRGRGRIVDCKVKVLTTVNMVDQMLYLYIDDNYMGFYPPVPGSEDLLAGLGQMVAFPQYINKETGLWYWRINPDVIFNTRFYLWAFNGAALANLTVTCRLIYNNVG